MDGVETGVLLEFVAEQQWMMIASSAEGMGDQRVGGLGGLGLVRKAKVFETIVEQLKCMPCCAMGSVSSS